MSRGAHAGGPAAIPEAVSLERSRQLILAAIGSPPDIALIQAGDGPTDQLIAAGLQALLARGRYRELDVQALPRERGHTAVLACGAGINRPRHDLLSRVLAVAELRFEQVIVLPTRLDAEEDVVRDALIGTRATVFASDPASRGQAAMLCDVQLAHDCAFFLDYSPYRQEGSGALDAFRVDQESFRDLRAPPGNDDISATRADLYTWLEAIATHAVVRSDDPHVLIAAALLGKRVQYPPDLAGKLEALAEFSLAGHQVSPMRVDASGPIVRTQAAPLEGSSERIMRALRDATLGNPPPRLGHESVGEPRISAVVVSRNRPELAARALDSLRHGDVPLKITVLDNNSEPVAARALKAICRDREPIHFRRLDRNLHAAGRQLGAELTDTELVLFLDDDAELLPGALAWMLSELDEHPGTEAVTATIVTPHALILHSGGTLAISAEVVEFGLTGQFRPMLDPGLPPSGPTNWAASTALLATRSLLDAFPMDLGMTPYFEDNEWAYRVARHWPGCFRRSREAIAFHQSTRKPVAAHTFEGRSVAVGWLAALSRFYERHGLLLGPWTFSTMPALTGPDGSRDLGGARLLMELVNEKGTDWVLTEWYNGELEGLLAANRYR